jgi:hypothetical protein
MSTSLASLARRLLRWEFVPEAVLIAGLTAFLIHQNDAATSAFKSSKAVAIMAAVTLGWLGARVVLARLVRFAVARAAVFAVAAAVALSVVVFPAYDNETVIESFPAAVSAPATAPSDPVPGSPSDTDPAAAPTSTSTTATTAAKASAPAPTSTTSTTLPPADAAPAAAPRASEAPATTATTNRPEAVPMQPEAAPAPAGPERLRVGMFRGIDHRASGTVAVYRQPDGRYVVGLEDIDIQPGPDYDLYVVPGEGREDTKGGVRLGDLRGNRGTQFYEVPAGVNLEEGPWTVLVWCQTFAVPVAGATPS